MLGDLPDVVKLSLLLDEAVIVGAVYPLTVPAIMELED